MAIRDEDLPACGIPTARTAVWIAALALSFAVGAACADETNGPVVAPPMDTVVPDTRPPADTRPVDTTPADTGPADTGPQGDVIRCTPLAFECASPTSQQQCNTAGDGWLETPCERRMGCEDGKCIEQVCSPYQTVGECIGDSHERCNPAGTGFEVYECLPEQYCYLGSCIAQLCTPGTRTCSATAAVQECSADGRAWVDAEICPKGGVCEGGECIEPCKVSIKAGSYLGCEYWALDLDNIEESENAPVGLVVSVPDIQSGTAVTIVDNTTGGVLSAAQLGAADTWVESGEVEVFTLPPGFDIDGSVKNNRTFKVTTTSPVAVHQFNPLNGQLVFSNDASLLLPSNVTGRTYFVMSWNHRTTGGTLRGFAAIIATQPGYTEIRIVPSAPVVAGVGISALTADTPYLFVLSQGEVLNLETDGEEGEDLTGTLVEANQKVSVISGHECANVPLGIAACDHIESQLFPVETWSIEYVADAFAPRSPSQVDIYRVIAGDNDVTVRTNPPVPGYGEFRLQRGQWIQFASPGSFVINSDGPIMVGHYLTGSAYPGAQEHERCRVEGVTEGVDAAIGDPAFTLAAPVKRYLPVYSVLTPLGYAENFLNVIVKDGTTVSIDQQPIEAPFVAIPGTGFKVATVPVDPGVHDVVANKPFGLTAYGYACDVSYAYPGGLRLVGFDEE